MQIRTLGPYHLLEQIGKGGMAAVFKAYDPGQDRFVAIKVLYPTMGGADGQFIKRFRREAEVVMRLKHPHIVPVEAFGEQDGFVYLVMPLLKVGSLADRLNQGALSPQEGSRIMQQVSEALQLAHDQGVVHRDVKPSNILMDEAGNALLSDFGLAQIHDASISLTGSALLGTPAYMSPEQASGGTVDARSDQYSLGVILYQLSTGELPFEAETPMAVLMKHIHEPLPPARMKSPGVPPAVERVILKATAKLPQERFASVAEFNQAFQAALAHAHDPYSNPEPRIAVPPSSMSIPASRVEHAQPKRRGRRLAAAAAVLLLMLLACPATNNGLRGLIDRPASPAEGSPLLAEMNDPQLTALAGTIEAMSTELASAGGGTLAAEDIPTMVMETLVADASSGKSPTPEGGAGTPPAVLPLLDPSATATSGPPPTASQVPTQPPSSTPGPSPTASKTPTKTLTPTPGPSPTPSRTPTITPTRTPGPSPTPTRTPSPTRTAPPSATPSPTMTAAPSPTSTEPAAIVPTDPPPTPTPDVCSQLSLGGFIVNGQEMRIKVTNDSAVSVTIDSLHLDWPPPNLRLRKIELGGDEIWSAGDDDPPSDIPAESNWKGPPHKRRIGPANTKTLTFFFDHDAEPGGYGLQLRFENGCTIDR